MRLESKAMLTTNANDSGEREYESVLMRKHSSLITANALGLVAASASSKEGTKMMLHTESDLYVLDRHSSQIGEEHQ